jgi:hypothetical protein
MIDPERARQAEEKIKMNRPMLNKLIPRALAWGAVIALGCAIAIAQDAGAAQTGQRSDGQIEMDVVHALDGSNALKNDLITAATVQGEVTLSGTVASSADSQLAESIASHVQGVTKVKNNLQVGNVQAAADAANDANAGQQQAADDSQAQEPAQPAPQDNGQQQPPAPDQSQQGMAPPPPPPPARPQYAPPYPPPPPYGYPYAPYGYPPPGYPPQPYAQQQQQPYPQQPQAPQYKQANGPVTVPQGTLVQVRTSEAVASKRAKDGEPVQFTLIRDVAVGGVLAIPRGATLHGVITEVKNSGALGGSPELALKLVSLDLGGQNYPIDSDQFKVKGPNKAGRTAGSALGGAILGAIIGGAVGRGEGAAIGAGAGAAAGTAASAASPGPNAWIPAEALVTFHIAAPVTVNPVSQEEAARLAAGLYPGGPNLYRRGYYGYPYPYGYPPVYYRPYFVSDGFYYWR